ncbi:MAG: DUF2625 domain-containing protein [Planctomycetaceae bacterium]|jgi:hypothetical protein|nr:DUF2625 domain-containing protein [Planctomycetaceae bacterium]
MAKRTLEQLINRDEPAITLIQDWIGAAENQCDVLPPSNENEEVLLEIQVTTRSPLGALAYETGGVMIDHGWLRFLGSGHPKLRRTLSEWNRGRNSGLCLVADDAVGGFFAINGGTLGEDIGNIYYWPPDRLEWEPLDFGFTDFFCWSLTSELAGFYDGLRWPNWKLDIQDLHGDQCFCFFPFLWTKEGSVTGSLRRAIPVAETFDLKVDIIQQLQQGEK